MTGRSACVPHNGPAYERPVGSLWDRRGARLEAMAPKALGGVDQEEPFAYTCGRRKGLCPFP
jgi:hypothetical protein